MVLTNGSGRGRRERMESRAMNIRRGRLLLAFRASIPFSKINRDSESLHFIIERVGKDFLDSSGSGIDIWLIQAS